MTGDVYRHQVNSSVSATKVIMNELFGTQVIRLLAPRLPRRATCELDRAIHLLLMSRAAGI